MVDNNLNTANKEIFRNGLNDVNQAQAASNKSDKFGSQKQSAIDKGKPKLMNKANKIKSKSFFQSFAGKITILGLVNFACILLLSYLLSSLPDRAKKISQLRSQITGQIGQGEVEVIGNQLNSYKTQIDKILALFPDESGLLAFVEVIDSQKQQGYITHFSFASNNPVKDKTGFLGIPVVIEFTGSSQQVKNSLAVIQNQPFLLRAINIETISEQNGNLRLKYGGMLYVAE